MGHYYDRAGREISSDVWGELFEDEEYQRIGLDVYPSLVDAACSDALMTVSTVWLGINHQFGNGPPIIFETMIFGGEYDNELTRYASEADALRGHQRTLDDLQHGRVPWFVQRERETSR